MNRCATLRHAFLQYTAKVADHKPHDEACHSKHCDFVNSGDVFVCLTSGRVHTCTSDACTLWELTRESRVCPVSGYSRPLELSECEIKASRQVVAKTETQKVNTQAKAEDDRQLKDYIQHVDMHSESKRIIQKLLFSEHRRKVNAVRLDQIRQLYLAFQRKHIAAKKPSKAHNPLYAWPSFVSTMDTLRDMMQRYNPLSPPQSKRSLTPDDRTLISQLVQRCIHTWQVVNKHRAAHVRQKRYKFETHVLVVLFCSASGIPSSSSSSSSAKWALEPIPGLKALVPGVNDIKKFRFRQRPFSRAETVFRDSILQQHMEDANDRIKRSRARDLDDFPVVPVRCVIQTTTRKRTLSDYQPNMTWEDDDVDSKRPKTHE
jgi:hypothetical protein